MKSRLNSNCVLYNKMMYFGNMLFIGDDRLTQTLESQTYKTMLNLTKNVFTYDKVSDGVMI